MGKLVTEVPLASDPSGSTEVRLIGLRWAYLESVGRELPEFTYKLSEVYGLLKAEFTGSKSR